MPKRIAIWNPARDVWEDEKGGTSLFCGHSDVFSGTFPGSGTTRNGVAYELRTWERRMGDTGSLSFPDDETDVFPTPRATRGGSATETVELLRTPCAAEDEGGPLHPDVAKARGQTLRLTGQILALSGDLLPTPRSSDTNGAGRHGTGGADLRTVVAEELMNRPAVAYMFGRFTPAIRRWESVLGREAPPPTVPGARGARARLNPAFCEWMMGLPPGWVTDPDIGLTRSQQLKALGNGVVPQQGAAAISDMLTTYERQDTTS